MQTTQFTPFKSVGSFKQFPHTVKVNVNNNKVNKMIKSTTSSNYSEQPAILSILIIPFVYTLCLPVLFAWFSCMFFLGGLVKLTNLIVYLTDFSIWLEMIVDLTTEINDFRKVTLSNWFFYLRELATLLNLFYKENKVQGYFDLLD